MTQPIVLMGGFLAPAALYGPMQQALAALSGQPVSVVKTSGYDWLPSVVQAGWTILLRRLDQAVRHALTASTTGRVTLIGHSAGGVLARLYLSSEAFRGHAYGGRAMVAHLITLGSPHYNRGGLQRGGPLARYVESRWPGAFFTPEVGYTAVVGRWRRGAATGTPAERFIHHVYRSLAGSGDAWGDGIVPVEAALLRGAEPLVLEGVSHFGRQGIPWYGSEHVLPLWWPVRLSAEPPLATADRLEQ